MRSMKHVLLAAGAVFLLLLWLTAPVQAQPANTPPVADAGSDQTVEATSYDGALVTLDGSGSSDADTDTLTYNWLEGASFLAHPTGTPTSDVTLALGAHTVTLIVEDGNGGADTDTVLVTVEDTTAPEIQSVTTDPEMLWPPNHKMKLVTVEAVVVDIADPEPTWKITGVSVEDLEREPAAGAASVQGKKDKPPKKNSFDWAIVDEHQVYLRAERLGNSNGRVYTITIEASDASGNTSTSTVEVFVPHDKRKK